MKLVDTHCHLDMIPDYRISLLRAKEAGVTTIINVGTSIDASKKSIEIAEGTDLVDVYATCGIHAQEGAKDIKKYGSLDKCIDELRNMTNRHSKLFTPVILSEAKNLSPVQGKLPEINNRSFGLRPQDDNDRRKKVVAIGECGMDFFLKATDQGSFGSAQDKPATTEDEKKAQSELFEVQVRLAKEFNLPLVVHCRNAWEETFEIIEKYSSSPSQNVQGKRSEKFSLRSNNRDPRPKGRGSLIFAQDPLHPRDKSREFSAQNKQSDSGVPFDYAQGPQNDSRSGLRGLFHSWTGTADQAKKALALGFYISFSGIVTFKNAGEIPKVAKMVPVDRILIETDSPFLSPVPLRGKQNEPKNVKITAQFLADLRGVSLDKISSITTDNAKRLFGIS